MMIEIDTHFFNLQKFTAGPGDSNRCKMSVVAEACSNLKVIYTTKEGDIYPEVKAHNMNNFILSV